MNFIKKFIDSVENDLDNKKEKMLTADKKEEKIEQDGVKHNDQETDVLKASEIKDNNNGLEKENILMDELSTQNSVKSLNEMRNKKGKEISMSLKKDQIEFKKEKSKSLKAIFFQFIVGVILILYTSNYVVHNSAEYKFLQSSVDLWVNTFEMIVNKFGGTLTNEINKNYIDKRAEFVKQLIYFEFKIEQCLDKTDDINKQKELKNLFEKIEFLRLKLADTSVMKLDDFIKNYNQYSLYIYSLQQFVDRNLNNCN